MDSYQAKLACRRNLPGIATRMDTLIGRRAADGMQSRGVMCLSLTNDQIKNYPVAEFALGIEQFPDADPARFVVKSPTDDHWTFGPDDVKLAIVGHIKTSSATIQTAAPSTQMSAIIPEYAMMQSMSSENAYISKNTKITRLLDLHIQTKSGLRLVRLIGQRTHIGIVGANPRRSLLDDTKPNEMVQILFPNTPLDTEFHDFDPPGDIRKLALKNGGKASTLTLESWAFYSPWIGLIKQTVYGW